MEIRNKIIVYNFKTINYNLKLQFTDFFPKIKKAIRKSCTFAGLKVRVYYPQTKKVKYLFEH